MEWESEREREREKERTSDGGLVEREKWQRDIERGVGDERSE